MKKVILLIAFFISSLGFSQTAPNFTCNDCSSNSHDLYTECNNGQVIVIAWVMPCGACISGALAGYTAVQSYPGQAKFYLADDVGNTSCTSMGSWATTNGMTSCDAIFSNAAVSQNGYGTSGMPKVVVVGGANHTIYYNQNGSAITQSGVQNAIAAAITANSIKKNANIFSSLNVFPNPSNSFSVLSLNLTKESKVKVEVQNSLGQKLIEVFNGNLPQGENSLRINTGELSNGNYFISCSDAEVTKKVKLVVLR